MCCTCTHLHAHVHTYTHTHSHATLAHTYLLKVWEFSTPLPALPVNLSLPRAPTIIQGLADVIKHPGHPLRSYAVQLLKDTQSRLQPLVQ